MDRRDFLKSTALIGAAALASEVMPGCSGEASAHKGKTNAPLDVKGYVREPAKSIPVIDKADVVVLGGGPAGVAAAVCAARQGADVMLLERQFYLGGLWTGGCVLPVIDVCGLGKSGVREQAIFGFMRDITERIAGMGMLITTNERPLPDPEAAKYACEQLVAEAGVRMLYCCQGANVIMKGDSIDSVIVETKSGRVAIKASVFVDCSGDGDMLEWTGEDFDVRNHHVGAMWRVGNASGLKRGKATPIDSVKYLHLYGEKNQNGLDVYNVTRLQLMIRKHIWDTLEKDRMNPGCEDLFVLDSGTIPGVRITRVMNSVCNVDYDGSINYRSYDDSIGMSGSDLTLTYANGLKGKDRPVWQIPYRSLTPKRVHNLLVAGRCFGFDEKLVYDAREVGTCFVTGQAAGTAAAQAALLRQGVRDIDVKELQKRLSAQDVRLR